MEWSGDVAEPYRTLTLTLSNTLNGKEQAVPFEVGKEVRFYANNTGLFRGIIFKYDITDRGETVVTAHDDNVYLTKNADSRKFTKMTAGAIVKEICKAFEIPVGTVANTGYVIPKFIFQGKTLWDMIVTALTETRKQNNRKFSVSSNGGLLYLRERKEEVVRWYLERGVNITGTNRSLSIEDTRTAVKVEAGEEKKRRTAAAKDTPMIAKYGLMQHYETADSDMKKSQLDQLAQQRLKDLAKVGEEIEIEALGNTEVISGVSVYAFESMTKTAGGYYVTADRHTFEGGAHRMTVSLSKTDDLPEIEYVDPA